MATLGIAETIRLIFLNEKWLANGSKGLYKIPKFLGELIHPQYYEYFYMIIVIIFIIVIYLTYNSRNSTHNYPINISVIK